MVLTMAVGMLVYGLLFRTQLDVMGPGHWLLPSST